MHLLRVVAPRVLTIAVPLALFATPGVRAQGAAAAPSAAAPSVATPALTGALRWADSARRIIDRAVVRGDTAQLLQGAALVDRALTAFPEHGLLLHYRGYAAYRLGQLAMSRKQEDAAEARYEEALAWLDRAVAAQPLAESHALRSSCMGQLIAGNALRGMRYGAAASRADDQALALGKNNPRVLLLQAVSAWYKPAMFGGGQDKARQLLARALAAFERDTPGPGLPSWGQAEALAWHGQWELAAGRAAAARAAYQQALTLEPEYAWVRYALLPAVR
ncbi:MAG: hypothetical protein LCH84_17380 [Gemmatimonadetes bacterium]|nr:hypothetical protein [Gemmatimonadota bacterium]